MSVRKGMISTRLREPGERLTTGLNCLSFDCGTSNLAYCLLEYVDEPDQEFSIRLWENFSLNSDTTAEAVVSLRRELDARPWMAHADHIAIEAQTNTSPVMKVISHTIQMYFLCRTRAPLTRAQTCEDGTQVEQKVGRGVSVHFISPKNKFKVCNVPEPEGVSGHAKNKRVAVLMAKKILGGLKDKSCFEYLMSHKKKDDLSDCFLQGLYFLRLIRQRSRASRKIMEHIEMQSEVNIIDETDSAKDRLAQRVYRGENFAVPVFDIDGANVSTAMTFAREKKSD